MSDLVEETVVVGGLTLSLARPSDPESLLDEEAFAADEFLPYWAELWPSSVALAEVVAGLALAGRSVLELGCGLALPSLVAAAQGAMVVASDWSDEAITLVERNARANGLRVRGVRADWHDPAALLDEAFDLILAADVLYEARNEPPLLDTVDRLLLPHGRAYVSDPGRRHAAGFVRAASRRGWHAESTRPPGLRRGVLHVLRRAEASTRR